MVAKRVFPAYVTWILCCFLILNFSTLTGLDEDARPKKTHLS